MTKEQAIEILKQRECCRECVVDNGDCNDCDKAFEMAIKALEIVEEFENAQIITSGRLNGRAFAYKCGLEDGERKALEKQSDDCVSRQAVIDTVNNTIAKYIPTFIGPYEKIPLELARAIKNVSPVTPTHGTCKDCKYLLRDSPDCFCCRITYRRMTNENFYCGNYEKREGEVVEMTREIWEERKNPPIDGKTDF